MGVIGQDGTLNGGGGGYQVPTPGRLILQRVTATKALTATGINIDSLQNDATVKIKPVIYTDSDGLPNALVASGAERVGLTAGWCSLPLTASLSAGVYWVGIISDSSAYIRYDFNTQECARSTAGTYPNVPATYSHTDFTYSYRFTLSVTEDITEERMLSGAAAAVLSPPPAAALGQGALYVVLTTRATVDLAAGAVYAVVEQAMQLIAVTPNYVPTNSGSYVSITGNGFTPDTTITFESQQYPGYTFTPPVTFIDSTQLIAALPSLRPGNYDATANDPTGTATLTNALEAYTSTNILPATRVGKGEDIDRFTGSARWYKVDTEALYPRALSDVKAVADSVGSAVTTVLDTVAATAKILDKIASASENPAITLIRKSLSEAAQKLRDIALLQAGVHALVVPPAPIARSDWRYTPPRFPRLDTAKVNKLTHRTGPGGNYGFFNTIVNSLSDKLDFSRPLYGPDDDISASVVVVGSNNTGEGLLRLSQLARLFGPAAMGLDGNSLVPPQDVCYRLLPIGVTTLAEPYITEENAKSSFAVHLSWRPVFGMSRPEYGLAVIIPKQVIVYRSQKRFDTHLSGDALAKYEYTRFNYNPVNCNFVDQDVEEEQVYYYALGYTYEVIDIQGNRTVYSDPIVSNPMLVPLIFPMGGIFPGSMGAPPDWFAMRGGLDLVPKLQAAIASLSVYLDTLANAHVVTGLGTLAQALAQLAVKKKELTAQLLTLIDEIYALFVPIGGVYACRISGTGGTPYFVSELLDVLTDTSDPNRPPFDTGQEFVGGLVFFAGKTDL